MGGSKARKGLLEVSQTQGELSDEARRDAARQREEAIRRGELERDIYERLSPVADRFFSYFDEDSAQPDRPDFSAGINRDYFDDIAGVTRERNAAIADVDDMMTAGGMARSGARGAAIGSIASGASTELSAARRNLQRRLEEEQRLAYEDKRMKGREGAEFALQGANILTGQQANMSSIPYEGLTSNSMRSASGFKEAGADALYKRSQIASPWEKALGAAGGVVGAATGVKGLWK